MQQQRDMTVTEPILKVMFAYTFESDHFRVKGLNCSLFSPTVSTLSGLKCIETRSEVSADSQANAVLLAMLTSLDGYIRTKPQRAAALCGLRLSDTLHSGRPRSAMSQQAFLNSCCVMTDKGVTANSTHSNTGGTGRA